MLKEKKFILLKSNDMLYMNLGFFKSCKYTGFIEVMNKSIFSYKEGKLHREDGPAIERADGSKEWWLNDVLFFHSKMGTNLGVLNFKNQVILDKLEHPKYPLVQVYQVLYKDKIEKKYIIPGMEEYIIQ